MRVYMCTRLYPAGQALGCGLRSWLWRPGDRRLPGGRNCGALCHCDEPTSEGGVEDVFRITSLTTGENHVRGKVAGVDLEWLGHGVISGSD